MPAAFITNAPRGRSLRLPPGLKASVEGRLQMPHSGRPPRPRSALLGGTNGSLSLPLPRRTSLHLAAQTLVPATRGGPVKLPGGSAEPGRRGRKAGRPDPSAAPLARLRDPPRRAPAPGPRARPAGRPRPAVDPSTVSRSRRPPRRRGGRGSGWAARTPFPRAHQPKPLVTHHFASAPGAAAAGSAVAPRPVRSGSCPGRYGGR